MESDPRPKTRVGGSRLPLAGSARRFPPQALEPRQETVTTSSTSASGVVEWLSNDPIGISGGLNQYVFCGNNPVNRRDPVGLAYDVIGIGANGMPIYGPERDWGNNYYDPYLGYRNGGRGAGAGAQLGGGIGFAGGIDVHASWINPATSRGGGVVGLNRMTFSDDNCTRDYGYDSFNRGGIGFDVGLAGQSVWAWGSGPWIGDFDSVTLNLGPLAASYFWSPGVGGWNGITFGLGLGLPGLGYEGTTYFDLDTQGK